MIEKILLADVLGIDLTRLIIDRPKLTILQKEEFKKKLDQLRQGCPLDYLLTKTEINGLNWRLNQQVLIPRPETESLINLVLKIKQKKLCLTRPDLEVFNLLYFENTELKTVVNFPKNGASLINNSSFLEKNSQVNLKPTKKTPSDFNYQPSRTDFKEVFQSNRQASINSSKRFKNRLYLQKLKLCIKKLAKKNLNLLDLGSGSGFIGLTLAKVFKKTVLSDISTPALIVARQNLQLQNQNQNITFCKSNLLKSSKLRNKIKKGDFVLIANLPYLPIFDKLNSQLNNISQEPNLALYSGYDGLRLFQKAILEIQRFNLKFEVMIFELDPRNIVKAKKLVKKYYENQIILPDFNNLDRFLIVW